MELPNFSKLVVLALLLSFMAGCSSNRSGDSNASAREDELGSGVADSGYGVGQDGSGSGGLYDRDGAGAGSGYGSGSGSDSSDEAALRAITTFYFEYDSSELRSEAMRSLDVHARDLMANKARVVLEGHTDERGTREYNMALGERRAKAVQRYLVMQGVSPSQIEVVSWGKERPEVLGSDEYAWAQNRRVELRAAQ